MDENYRIRDAIIVNVEDEKLEELHEMGSFMTEVDGSLIEFRRDTAEGQYDSADVTLMMGMEGPDRLLSGFTLHYYGVIGDLDLLLMAENRLDLEEALIDRAGGPLTTVPEDELEESSDESDNTVDIDSEDLQEGPSERRSLSKW